MKKILSIFFCISASFIFAQNVTIIKSGDFIGQNIGINNYLSRKSSGEIPFIYNIKSKSSLQLKINQDIPILSTYFPIDEDRFYVVSGGTWANEPKDIIEFNLNTGVPTWGYRVPGDFFTGFSYKDNHLYTGFRNSGVILDFDIVRQSIRDVQLFDSGLYHIYKYNNENIFTNGANNYKNRDYAIKILDNELNVKSEYKGFSDSYRFRHNKSGLFLTFSQNQYLDPDKTVHIYNYEMEILNEIVLEKNILDACFTTNGQNILVAHGYAESSVISIYELNGEFIRDIKVNTDEEYERIISISGSLEELIVVLGISER